MERMKRLFRIDQTLPLAANPAVPDLHNADLAEARAVVVRSLDIDDGKDRPLP